MPEPVLIGGLLASPHADHAATVCPFCKLDLAAEPPGSGPNRPGVGECPQCHWARDYPYFEVEKVCRPPDEVTRRTPLWKWHHGCGRIWTGFGLIPMADGEPARHHPCDRCIDRIQHERAVFLARRKAEQTGQPVQLPPEPTPF